MQRLRHVLAVAMSVVSVVAAGAIGDLATTRLRGVNRSDVGVVVWSQGRLAIADGTLAYVASAALLLWAVLRGFGLRDRWIRVVGAARFAAGACGARISWLLIYR